MLSHSDKYFIDEWLPGIDPGCCVIYTTTRLVCAEIMFSSKHTPKKFFWEVHGIDVTEISCGYYTGLDYSLAAAKAAAVKALIDFGYCKVPDNMGSMV